MKITLVPNAKRFLHWSSVHFAGLCALALAALVDNVSWIVSLVNIIPRDNWRYLTSIGVFFTAFGLPLFFRITHIKWRSDDNETNHEG